MPPPASLDTTMKQAKTKLDKMKQYLSVGMQNCSVTALDLIDAYKDNADEKLPEVQDMMLEFCQMDKDLQDFTTALHAMHDEAEHLEDNAEPVDLEDLLDKKLRDAKGESRKRNIKEHEKFVEFHESIQDQLNNADDATSVAGSEAQQAEDEDIAVTQSDVQTKCPITGKEMEDPVKNKFCGHRYDRQGILAHIKTKKGRAKCPIGACANPNFIDEEDLEEDRELRKFIQRKGRAQTKRRKP